MAHLIDKSALVAEIMSRINSIEVSQKAGLIKKRDAETEIILFKSILSLIDTLEVKEVDLEKEFESFLDNIEGVPRMWHSDEQIEWAKDIAKHFFELGMQASNTAQKGE